MKALWNRHPACFVSKINRQDACSTNQHFVSKINRQDACSINQNLISLINR
jgi:hypothetical protein